MTMIFGVPTVLLFGQLLLGAINGAFYAMLSLGLAIIFGMLNIVNFAHGAVFMVGAFGALILQQWLGINYWWALVIVPIAIGMLGMLFERTILQRLKGIDPIYGVLLTYAITLMLEGVFRNAFGTTGIPYSAPPQLQGGVDIGFMFMPVYRGWAVAAALAVCLATWFLIEKTSLGAKLRAATENARLVQAFGINVGKLVTLTFGLGLALAALAGVLAAPIYSVSPGMGANLIIVVFAVVVIGGMGSILGSIVAGFGLGILEALTRIVYPQGSAMVVFVVMALVLLIRPAGLFGRAT